MPVMDSNFVKEVFSNFVGAHHSLKRCLLGMSMLGIVVQEARNGFVGAQEVLPSQSAEYCIYSRIIQCSLERRKLDWRPVTVKKLRQMLERY